MFLILRIMVVVQCIVIYLFFNNFYHINIESELLDVFFLSVSPCDFNLCENGGTCTVDASGTAVCTCSGGWTGANCTGTFKLYRYMVGN